MVRISDIQNNIVLWDTVPYCEIAESDIGTYLLQTNDILFARTGSDAEPVSETESEPDTANGYALNI